MTTKSIPGTRLRTALEPVHASNADSVSGCPLLREEAAAKFSSWLVSGQPAKEANYRILCFHHAGGSATQFKRWNYIAPYEAQFIGIQLPGRGHRSAEPPFHRLEQLLDELVSAVADHLNTPFALFGHSVGALVAFEFARRLRRIGANAPAHLFVASRPAPQLSFHHAPAHELTDAELVNILRVYGGTDESILRDPATLQPYLPAIRADLDLSRTYQYDEESPLPCAITAIGGASDRLCGVEELLEWRHQTVGPFQHRIFTGGHFFLNDARQVVALIVASLACPHENAAGSLMGS